MELRMEGLNKNYGATRALSDFTGTLYEGIYGLLGPNGAGKSTLMNIIAGNLRPDAGCIRYNGTDVRKLGEDYRAVLGYMPQQQGVYESFTGYRFLSYIAALKGMDGRKARKQIEQTAEMVHLTDSLHKKLGSYSGGMKQRILIAQAVLNDPKILIFDEPTAGLDPKERIHIRNMISEIAANKIIIWATHVVSDVESIAKEVLLLKNGILLAKDTPENLLKNIEGKVYELLVPSNLVQEVQRKYVVSGLTLTADGMLIRILAEEEPKEYSCRKVSPSLEEEYLYVFAGKEGVK